MKVNLISLSKRHLVSPKNTIAYICYTSKPKGSHEICHILVRWENLKAFYFSFVILQVECSCKGNQAISNEFITVQKVWNRRRRREELARLKVMRLLIQLRLVTIRIPFLSRLLSYHPKINFIRSSQQIVGSKVVLGKQKKKRKIRTNQVANQVRKSSTICL